MQNSIIGYPRIGALRELKFATESYFKKNISSTELEQKAKEIRKTQWKYIASKGIDFIPSNDFSFYDNLLDTAFLLGIIPERYKALNADALTTYFAMARGYQDEKGDVKALPMKKWFNTNYHYIVPEFDDKTELALNGTKPFDEYNEAKALGIQTKPVIIGPFTLLKLASYSGSKKAENYIDNAIIAYKKIIEKIAALGAEWIQFDEPFLVTDLSTEDKSFFTSLYKNILGCKQRVKVLLQTYFGDIRDIYTEVTSLDFDGIGIDFIEGKKSLELIEKNGFPKNKKLFAGVVNGKNIWRNNYAETLSILEKIGSLVDKDAVVINTSCSLLHVPYTLEGEKLTENQKAQLTFAKEKLNELDELKILLSDNNYKNKPLYNNNVELVGRRSGLADKVVQEKVASLRDKDFIRLHALEDREKIQKKVLGLPLLPTTTIGSFPQTAEVKANRAKWKKGEISSEEYKAKVKAKIASCIKLQEEIGLDVLVHGEFERNDMVEHFGENLEGYLFTVKAWVQSYGTRCVKPPIIWSDIKRSAPITVDYSVYAQSLTEKHVKGMLTGPVTILNWSFPREDITNKEMAFQIALAIKEEVSDLEAAGIRIIQVDEAALKEKLPIRREDWNTEYLDWAIPAFRLVHSGVNAQTQIHTHMCYSEFSEIVKDIENMDADVISFEASRSKLLIVDALKDAGFRLQVGPGVYDIHSPRIPSEEEITTAINNMLEDNRIKKEKLWVNPDCGLKTRGEEETIPSLVNLVNAAKKVRNGLS
ncbi:MAG: 5-methyltetrahydropteroyltriglutamate--homocysteine S-methyltransferase [Clostridiales bacterium GWF2_36_10]|nr:MAG: 5-methyltetrahydropteroyltriglutamate--homocysteine S-methyltransferase [Clostridiales bacterium GWF2_36_10]HAN21202.1 5-methyltetrahydropteroyltriglutamate--homocysteine S-methyltransferase [Clostridiales bacterium]